MKQVKRIGIYPGSFDPIHNAHMAVAKASLKQFNLDSVYFAPSSKSVNKDAHHLDYINRCRLVDLVCEAESQFSRLKCNVDSYYFEETLYLAKKHFDNIFSEYIVSIYLIMGEDTIMTFDTWKNFEKILNNCNIIVCGRDGEISEETQKKIDYLNHNNPDYWIGYHNSGSSIRRKPTQIYTCTQNDVDDSISSSEFRDKIWTIDYNDVLDYVHPSVYNEVIIHNLYK